MQTPVATNHAEMMANIRAAIASAPAYQYEGSHIPEFRPLADGEPIEPDLMTIDTRAPMVYMHGPTRPHDLRISIRYCIDGVRGSYAVPHGADRLQALADKVARLAPAFDGKPRMRRLPQGLPKKSRVTAAGSFGVVRQLLDDRQYAEALALAQSNCGPVFIGHAAKGTRADATMADALSRAVYLQCVNHSAGGVDWIIGRHAAPGGRWRILHASSGLWLNRRDASDCATHEFRSAADAMATIDQWTAEDNEAEYARKIIAACHRAAPFDQAAALADLTGSAPEPIAEEIQPEPAADDAAPVSDCMAAIIEAASEPEPVADDASIAHAEFDAAGAADTASHPLEAAAQHLAKRRAQLAEPAPELAPIAAEPEPEAAPAEPINPEPSGIVGLILHNVLVPFVNAAPDGKPAAADLMREADRLRLSSARVLADCIGMPTERCARQTASDYAEVARRLELMAEPEPEPEPIAPDAPDTAPPVPAAPAARDLSLSYAAHVAQSRAIGSRPMSCAQWVRNNTPKPAAPIAPPNPGNPGRAAHPGRCSARRPGVAVRIKPAAPAASRAPGRLAARNIRAAGFRSHRAAIAPHRAGRLAAASRGAVRSIGCAGRPGRGAPPAAGCTILQAPGQAAGGAAGPGPPSGATPRPADSQTPYSRRFPHTGDSP